MEKMRIIKSRDEWVVLIGDLNKAVGNGEYGVKGNHEKVSFGGKLIHKLLETKKYILVNNTEKCSGGPFTRFDPSDPSNENKMSCLELVILDEELFDFVHEMTIDRNKIFTPHRPVGKGKLRYTDHFSIILRFKNIPEKKIVKKCQTKAVT